MKPWIVLVLLGVTSVAGAEPLALTHVIVIDGRGGPVLADRTVVITGDKITAVGTAAPPRGARIVDATGKYLIPGLWDMHVHWYDSRFLPLFVANGVTGVRQMFGTSQLLQWRAEIAAGKLLGPRQVVASPIVDGHPPVWPGSAEVTNAKEGADVVRRMKAASFDFVKVYSRIPRDAYFAIAAEAKRVKIPFAGHVPNLITVAEASDAGQRSLEHMQGLLHACSTIEDEVRAERARLSAGMKLGVVDRAAKDALTKLGERILSTFDDKKADALFQRLAKNGTWLCPTFTVSRAFAFMRDPAITQDPRLKYMPSSVRESWKPENNPVVAASTDDDYDQAQRLHRKEMELIPRALRAGVRILAGTDVLNPYCMPGFSLHDELGLLVKAGMTPMQALQAATRNPAAYLGLSRTHGTIEKGKVADLVLLDADPVQDIGNTRKIAAVIQGGRLHDRASLDRMLADAEKLGALKNLPGEMQKLILGKGVPAAVELFRQVRANPEGWEVSEDGLNSLGYALLGEKKTDAAVTVLELTAEAYPDSANAHDSLGEAYAAAGNKAAAIKSYQRALELDPNSENARMMLKKLRE